MSATVKVLANTIATANTSNDDLRQLYIKSIAQTQTAEVKAVTTALIVVMVSRGMITL